MWYLHSLKYIHTHLIRAEIYHRKIESRQHTEQEYETH